MKIQILGNSGSGLFGAHSMSSLINENILFDCGTGLVNLDANKLTNITDVVLSHVHLDHTAMLPFLLDYKAGTATPTVTVHCLEETAKKLETHVFNGYIWPNFTKIIINGAPVLKYNIIQPYEKLNLGQVQLTPLPIIHQIQTIAICLHSPRENFVFIADIYDAEDKFWQYLANLDNFSQMVIETSFPNHMEKIAIDSYHLTPQMLQRLIQKTPPTVEKIYYCHTKPAFIPQIAQEINDLNDKRISPLQIGQVFEF